MTPTYAAAESYIDLLYFAWRDDELGIAWLDDIVMLRYYEIMERDAECDDDRRYFAFCAKIAADCIKDFEAKIIARSQPTIH
jgi:hypothetical protein